MGGQTGITDIPFSSIPNRLLARFQESKDWIRCQEPRFRTSLKPLLFNRATAEPLRLPEAQQTRTGLAGSSFLAPFSNSSRGMLMDLGWAADLNSALERTSTIWAPFAKRAFTSDAEADLLLQMKYATAATGTRLLKGARQDLGRLNSDHAVQDLAFLDDQQGGDALNAELGGEVRFLVYIDFGHDGLVASALGYLVKDGPLKAAGTAPWGPEIDEDRGVLGHDLLEGAGGEVDDVGHETPCLGQSFTIPYD
jgi:hypothetical protein